jgi:hypothetical protein
MFSFKTRKTFPDEFWVSNTFPVMYSELIDEDIKIMWISRWNLTKKYITWEKQWDNKKYIELNKARSIFKYKYQLEWILSLKWEQYNKKMYDHQKEKLLDDIIGYDYERLKDWKEIDWNHYWLDENNSFNWLDFINKFHWKSERIQFNILFEYEDINSLSELNKKLRFVLKKIIKKIIDDNFNGATIKNWNYLVNDRDYVRWFITKISEIIWVNVDKYKEYKILNDIFQESLTNNF